MKTGNCKMATSFHDSSCTCNVVDIQGNPYANSVSLKQTYQYAVESCSDVKLLVVGNKEYDNGANGIAFCKNSWLEILQPQCSGRYLLCALGINFQNVCVKYHNPVELFLEMAKRGIVFLNQKNFSNTPLIEYLQLHKPKIVLLCGSPVLMSYLKIQGKINVEPCRIFKTVHPDVRNANKNEKSDWFSRSVKEIWMLCWGSHGGAITYLRNNVSSFSCVSGILTENISEIEKTVDLL